MENEFIHQVREDISAYLQTETILSKLRIVGGLSRVLGLFLLMLTVVLLFFGLLAFCCVAAIVGLSYCMPLWAAALVVGSLFVVGIILVVSFRKQLFINPFVKLLSGVLFEKEGRQIEEERLREEAIHD